MAATHTWTAVRIVWYISVAWERSKVQSPFELYVDLLQIITGLRNCKSSCHVRYCVCVLIYSSNRSHHCGESRNLRSADEAQQAGLGTLTFPPWGYLLAAFLHSLQALTLYKRSTHITEENLFYPKFIYLKINYVKKHFHRNTQSSVWSNMWTLWPT